MTPQTSKHAMMAFGNASDADTLSDLLEEIMEAFESRFCPSDKMLQFLQSNPTYKSLELDGKFEATPQNPYAPFAADDYILRGYVEEFGLDKVFTYLHDVLRQSEIFSDLSHAFLIIADMDFLTLAINEYLRPSPQGISRLSFDPGL